MPASRLAPSLVSSLTVAATLSVGSSVLAQEAWPSSEPPPGTVAPAPPPSTAPTPMPPTGADTTVSAQPGSGGLTVISPTGSGGSVVAAGCSTVMVRGTPTLVGPGGAPCPTYAPYQPTVYAPGYLGEQPRYARDPERTTALIASSLVYGLGGTVSGIMYLLESNDGGNRNPTPWLLTYGALISIAPSVPRFVVGDTTKGLIYSAIRGASFAAGAFIDWGTSSESKFMGPFVFAFLAPVTFGIVDLATTPHREDLVERPGVTGVAPVALADKAHGTHGALLSVSGIF